MQPELATVTPHHVAYAIEETDDSIGLLGVAVPAYGGIDGFGAQGVQISPTDWSRVNLLVHGVAPYGVPTLRSRDANPHQLESWLMPDVGTDRWDSHTREWHTVENANKARGLWGRLTLRAAHQERRMDAGNIDANLLAEAIRRLEGLGWRTISVRRLAAIAAGDNSQLPHDRAGKAEGRLS